MSGHSMPGKKKEEITVEYDTRPLVHAHAVWSCFGFCNVGFNLVASRCNSMYRLPSVDVVFQGAAGLEGKGGLFFRYDRGLSQVFTSRIARVV